MTGPIEQPHVQWWSTVLRVSTDDGTLWFKAAREAHTKEAPLLELLARTQPDRVPELVAVDTERDWTLMHDGGTRLRELVVEGSRDVHHWEALLPGYALLQIALTPKADALHAMGVPDERLAGLPDRLARLLDAPEYLMLDRPGGLTSNERERLTASIPQIASMCSELAAYGIGETLQHDDINDGNVFVDRGRYRIFDWGDSCVSHPFHSLTVALRAAAWKLDLEPGGAEVVRMRDAYLEPFSDQRSRHQLGAAADLAHRTGTLARAIAWWRFVDGRPSSEVGDDIESVPYGLKKFLEHAPMGSWRDPL